MVRSCKVSIQPGPHDLAQANRGSARFACLHFLLPESVNPQPVVVSIFCVHSFNWVDVKELKFGYYRKETLSSLCAHIAVA